MSSRASRPVKRLRRLSTEDSEGADDLTLSASKLQSSVRTSTASHSTSRPRRGVAAPASATVERRSSPTSSSPEETRLHLTVKAAPSKLREAISANGRDSANNTRGGPLPRGARNKKVIVDESSEEEEEEEEEEPDDDLDALGEDEEDMDEEMDDDEDAEGEEDEEMDDAPPPPVIKAKPATKPPQKASSKPMPLAPDVSTVEAKEMAMDDASDDELSELSEEEVNNEEDDEELGDEDAEGEDDLGEEDAEGEDDLGSDDDTPRSGSGTPDLSKLTRRQRAAFQGIDDGGYMALSNEAQKKKHLTAEEQNMRRAEMARRRKNLSEKRNEEEKLDTINRLLKRQAPKKRGRAALHENADSAAEEEAEPEKPSAIYTRYVQNAQGVSLSVPEEWLKAAAGDIFQNSVKDQAAKPFNGRMVEEVS